MSVSENVLRAAIVVLCLVGAGIATYLTVVDFVGDVPVCAAGGHGCATVARSPYSHLLGIPVSVFGGMAYAAILVSALVRGENARIAGFVLALAGVGFSAYLTYLELFVINAICQWCVASAVTMVGVLVACTMRFLGAVPAGAGGAP
jgi:uncharacterized membrane protein